MQMKGYKKTLASFFIIFLLSSLNVRSETASNQLDLTVGTIVMGDIDHSGVQGTNNFTVDRIWHDSFYDMDFVEFTIDMMYEPPWDPDTNRTREIITFILVNDNRTLMIPIGYYFVETVDYNITVFIDYTDDLNMTQEDLRVIYNGTTYVYDDIDPGESFYDLVSFWVFIWAMGSVLFQQIMPLFRYAISPQATTGQEIDYGFFTGTVVGFTEYYISETEYFEAIEVHHDPVPIDGVNDYGESTLLYEKNTGIILHWLEYNATTDTYGYYNATNVIGISPLIVVPEFSIPSIIILSSSLIAIPILIYRRKKK